MADEMIEKTFTQPGEGHADLDKAPYVAHMDRFPEKTDFPLRPNAAIRAAVLPAMSPKPQGERFK
jgi:hypothetical protein